MSTEDDQAEQADYSAPYEEANDEDAEDNIHQPVSGSRHAGVLASSFRDMLLKEQIQRAITELGFEHPSEVQQDAIPQALTGHDVICQAKAGMGKTAVFVIAILQQLSADMAEGVDSIVLCHTRELAYQIHQEFMRFAKFMPEVKVVALCGGFPKTTHQDLLKETTHIVVGTPGRILDLINDGSLKVGSVKHFVVDECDQLLGSDMRVDVQRIFKLCPKDKQVMMFTATLSSPNKAIAVKFCSNPEFVIPDSETKLKLEGLVQYHVRIDEAKKNRKLHGLLRNLEYNQCIVFVKSLQRCKKLHEVLIENNQPCSMVHGKIPVEKRMEIFNSFKEWKTRILVCTDVYGRGVDFEKVNIVINYDLPDAKHGGADQYLHRVGRSGRFGTKGLAISFVSSSEDQDVIRQVQSRFEAEISELPDQIEKSRYMD